MTKQSDLFFTGGAGAIAVPSVKYLGELTTTGTWTTNTTYSGQYWQKGKFLKAIVRVDLSGAPNNTALDLNLPNSYTVDADFLPDQTNNQFYYDLGAVALRDNSAGSRQGRASYNNTSGQTGRIEIQYNNASTSPEITYSNLSATAPFTWASGDYLLIEYEVPVTQFDDAELVGTIGLATESAPGLLNRSDKGTAVALTTAIVSNLDSAPTVQAYWERVNDLVFLQLFVTAEATGFSSWEASITRTQLAALGIDGEFLNLGMGSGYRSDTPTELGQIYSTNTTDLMIRGTDNTSGVSRLWVFNMFYRSTV